MRIQLPEQWSIRFAALPENGMGYHLVDVRLCDGRRLSRIPLFNSSVLFVDDEIAAFQPEAISEVVPSFSRNI